jgi:hypothetical protein
MVKMDDNKICLGNWDNCPEAISTGLCRKVRNCIIEIPCMKEWLKLNHKNN